MSAQPSNEVIGFIDIDAFEVQAYQNKDFPQLRGTPCIVADSTGRIVSVSHEAKLYGVTRSIRVHQARDLCNPLNVITKPNRFGKPDAKTPRHGSWAVFDALKAFCSFGSNVILENASSDGFFVDMTEEVNNRIEDEKCINLDDNVHLMGYESLRNNPRQFFKKNTDEETFRLICGASYVTQMVASLLAETGMECSVGVSCNKLVAKMACTLNKPAGITILTLPGFYTVTDRIDISDITGFGGENGVKVKQMLRIHNIRELAKVSLSDLQITVGYNNMARKLYDSSRGIYNEPVYVKGPNKNVSCGKSFFRKDCHMNIQQLLVHLTNRAREMEERLEEEKTRHMRITDSLQIQLEYKRKGNNAFLKRTNTFNISSDPNHYTRRQIPQQVLQIIQGFPGVTFNPEMEITKITLSASKWTSMLSSPPKVQNNTGRSPAAGMNFCFLAQLVEPEEDPSRKVYQLRISLDRVNPKIWRVIRVPEDFTFYQLHKAIQDAIGWESCMFHEFVIGQARDGLSICVGSPNDLLNEVEIKHTFAEKETSMTMFLAAIGDQIVYQHGCKEKWPHTVVLEKILPAIIGLDYPYCIDGERAAPLDDEDFFNFKDKEFRESGFDLNYDPNRFNPNDVVFNDVMVSSDDEN